ncbi:MAG: polysaccharide deacetylase family protein [Clostridium sp.]
MKAIIKVLILFLLIIGVVFGAIYAKRTFLKPKSVISENSQVENEVSEEERLYQIEAKKIQVKENLKRIEYVKLKPEDVNIPILMYHSIADYDGKNNLLVPVAQFTEQMKWLNDEGFTPMLMADVIKAMKSGEVPKKPVAITFDDGYADNYSAAFKALVDNNMKGTFFIITDKTDADSWYMNSTMLKEMASKGMGIENHTSKHQELNKISRANKIAIIKEAKDFLKEKVGVDSKFLCYPVGRYDDETIKVAKELGLEGAVTTNGGLANIKTGEFELNRVRMSPMSLNNFKEIFKSYMNN